VTQVSFVNIGSGGARDMNGELPWRLDASQSGGGLIMDVRCHIIDNLDYICGPFINDNGVTENRNSPSVAVKDYVRFTVTIGKTEGDINTRCKDATDPI